MREWCRAMPTRMTRQSLVRWLAALGIALAAVVGCVELKEFAAPQPPAVGAEWRELLDELRVFERRIGFRPTSNFAKLTTDRQSFPFCGQASNHRLPYSYQDSVIGWLDDVTEAKCREVPADIDVYYGEVEAWGEIGTPVTAAMVAGTIDRFIYLVIHEDCHDQFELPNGIEEPLCDILTHRAMAEFSSEKFRWYAREHRAIKHYTRSESRHARATISHYAELERLYQRFERNELSHEALLRLRAQTFARAERSLELSAGQLNSILLANYMTYSRHLPQLERSIDRLQAELPEVLEFFRLVDRRKPSEATVMQRLGVTERKNAAFLRAYEAAVMATIEQVLIERTVLPSSG